MLNAAPGAGSMAEMLATCLYYFLFKGYLQNRKNSVLLEWTKISRRDITISPTYFKFYVFEIYRLVALMLTLTTM
jgi:hypothetical protein